MTAWSPPYVELGLYRENMLTGRHPRCLSTLTRRSPGASRPRRERYQARTDQLGWAVVSAARRLPAKLLEVDASFWGLLLDYGCGAWPTSDFGGMHSAGPTPP